MKFLNAVIFAIVSAGSLSAFAGNRNMLVWSDAGGFVEKSCKIKPAADIDFAIADDQNNDSQFIKIQSVNSGHEFNLPKYSVIRITENPALEGNILLSVIGSSKNPGVESDNNTALRFWGTSAATRIGAQQSLYIDENSVRSANDYVIELLDKNNPKLVIEQNMNAESTLWTTQINSDFFTTAECCVGKKCEDYTVFNVFKKTQTEAKFLTMVGVSTLDTEIFSNIMVYPKNPIKNDTEKSEDESKSEDSAAENDPIANIIEDKLPENILPKQGTLETVVCLENVNHSLSVRDDSLDKILFSLKNGSTVKIFQGWDQDEENKSKIINGKTYNYVRVQTDDGIGYAPKELLKDKSECESIELQEPQAAKRQNSDTTSTPSEDDKLKADTSYFICTESGESLSVRDLNFKRLDRAYNVDHKEKVTVLDPADQTYAGIHFVKVKTESGYTRMIGADYLNSKECSNVAAAEYVFPTYTATGYSYLENSKRPRSIREFSRYRGYTEAWGAYGARRSAGKRAHAATDLYQKRGQSRPSGAQYTVSHFGGAFRAMTSGRIVRGPTAFYLGTYYSVILHDDNTVGIYGETYGNLLADGRINAGEKLGYIKWVGENAVPAMLHMEHYRKSDAIMNDKDGWKGSKKINGRNSKRAEQLFDRTDFIKSLEARNF